MSRILDALQRARQQQSANTAELPDVDEIVAAGVTPPRAEARQAELHTADRSILATCRRQNWELSSGMLFLSDGTDSAGQEQFRTLRSRLYQLREMGQLSVIVIGSALPQDGKSFVAANLAYAFALQSGRQALLIDADLRRVGGLDEFLKAPQGPGLVDYLKGERRAEEIIQKGQVENLYLISSGVADANAGELVGSPAFPRLVEQLRPVFDWIIIDTPPTIPISDAPLIADFSDGVLLVVNATSTPSKMAKRAAQQFRKESMLGVVLNRSAEPSRLYYSYSGYGYSGARSRQSE
jgi:capsular exopolysaccharide synthesis family protein